MPRYFDITKMQLVFIQVKISPRETWHMVEGGVNLNQLRMSVQCQNPTVDLYRFAGNLINIGQSNTSSLNIDNLLLRDSGLKDTDYIYGYYILLI